MEKGKSVAVLTGSWQKLDLSPISNSKTCHIFPNPQSCGLSVKRKKPPSLVTLCLEVVGRHLEDIIVDLGEIADCFPAYIKMAVASIARRRKLLNDDVIISLADSSWEILDISGSDASDIGLAKVAEICRSLRALDISRCEKISTAGVTEVVKNCRSLETLRCGGSPRSDFTARGCLGVFKPKLKHVEGDSWEELDANEIANGSESLRWFVWPNIDNDTLESFSAECPRIIVNPKSSRFGFRGIQVPREALQNITVDDPVVEDMDPGAWAVSGFAPKAVPSSLSSPTELSVAEKFRLAFVERDTRLAPKRAKNARQHQRRAEREWVLTSTEAKAIALAKKMSKSLHGRS